MAQDADVVVVGGGIAGSALATALAGAGIAVRILERSEVHIDHVRGEWLAPWGVVEAQRLGLYDLLIAAGGHHVSQHIAYGEEVDPAQARMAALDLTGMAPGVPGPLCLGHPTMCNLFNRTAEQAGATLQRGVKDIVVRSGAAPEVSFRIDGVDQTLRPRLVIGADGRNSVVRQQAGIPLHKNPPHHLMAGMLVERTGEWPADVQVIGTEGDVNFFVFPQLDQRARLYLCYAYEHRKRFAGRDAAANVLAAFRLRSVPGSEHIAAAQPAGPCHAYPNEDTWTDPPLAPGVVLIGDAAGHNDPIIGQGLSIALRDVRLVRDLMIGEREWTPSVFEPYVTERRERMRRLRFVGTLAAVRDVEFGPEATARRARAFARQLQDPSVMLPVMATLMGPDALPPEAFEQPAWDRLLSE
jgi:2-polyprenyl-6-methoxyphenol hydroxylase-like FAD-dependent oxidoreductase